MDHHNDTMTRQHRIRPIHTAIGEGAYPRLVRLLHRDFHPIEIRPYEESMLLLLWEPNGTPGWTACHFAASQFVPAGWWEWILRIQAASVHRRVPTFSSSANNNQEVNRRMNMFLESKNALGQTVTDIFFRSYVRPVRTLLVIERMV